MYTSSHACIHNIYVLPGLLLSIFERPPRRWWFWRLHHTIYYASQQRHVVVVVNPFPLRPLPCPRHLCLQLFSARTNIIVAPLHASCSTPLLLMLLRLKAYVCTCTKHRNINCRSSAESRVQRHTASSVLSMCTGVLCTYVSFFLASRILCFPPSTGARLH